LAGRGAGDQALRIAGGGDASNLKLAADIGEPGRFYGLHVFNPVTRMELIELALPGELDDGVADRARAFSAALGKTGIEVPDTAGFVVNRLLFPYLFDAVRFLESSGMEPADVDACMTMGTGQPMGPLKLLDFIGLDVSVAIGDSLVAESGEAYQGPPEVLRTMLADGKLGRKTKQGFYEYG
jgi:3-hydroxyacyl-CoA dehydrogenase